MSQEVNARTQFFLSNPTFIINVARKIKIKRCDADDFSQSVILKSLQDDYVNFGNPVEADAYWYVVKEAYKFKRKINNRHEIPFIDSYNQDESTPETIAENKESISDIISQIKQNGHVLTERQLQVIQCFDAGKTPKETAKILKVSHRRILYIRQAIRKKLLKKNEPRPPPTRVRDVTKAQAENLKLGENNGRT